MKRTLFLTLILTALLAIFCITASAETYSGYCGGDGDRKNLTWRLNTTTGTMIIDGNGTMGSYTKDLSELPWISYTDSIKSVTIKDGVTTIGDGAFYYCQFLSSVKIPNSVITIGNSAFSGCSSLVELELPNSVTIIGDSAFYNCTALSKIEIPNSVSRIGDRTFYHCDSLVEMNIPNSVTIIGEDAFYGCSALEKIEIPNSVKTIGRGAFCFCIRLTYVSLPTDLASIESSTFGYSGLVEVEIPCSVISIGDHAIYGSDLTDVYYYGNLDQWNSILIGSDNEELIEAKCHYMNINYIPNQNGTHLAQKICTECDMELGGSVEEACADSNRDEACDRCRNFICAHTGDAKLSCVSNDDGETHQVTIDCVTCGEILYVTQMAQNCTDKNGYCALCGQDLSCRHGQTHTYTSYNPNEGEETHKTMIAIDCDQCGERISYWETEESCVDTQPDLLCDYCGQALACHHAETVAKENYYDNGNRTHKVIADMICVLCGETAYQQIESEADRCIDRENDDLCDLCDGDLSCNHGGSTKLVYTSNKDATHAVTLNCSICMDVLYDVMKAENCSFADGVCTKCGGMQIEQFDIPGANMTLGNDLKINFLIKKADFKDGYVAKVTQEGKEPVQLELWSYNDQYYAASYSVAAKEMTDGLSCEIYDAEGYLVSNPFTRTIKQYAMTLLNNASQKASLKSVIVDMLNYGTEAQKYFHYNEDAYANADVTEAQQTEFATKDVTCVNNQVKGEKFLGSNLSLEDSILLNVFFSETGTDGLTAKVSFTDYLGVAVEDDAEVTQYNASMVKVIVNQVVLADSRRPVTIKLYDGETVVGQCIESVESYIARNINNTSTGAINTAIMKFAISAYNYLGGTT